VTVGDELRSLRCDRLVAALGFIANLGPLLEWGVEIQQRRHIVVDTTMSSTVPGVYAAGDICEYPGKVRLIATGFGEVATAVNNAVQFIDPKASVFPGHLSDYAPPGALGSP
jgi:thioredoxin reductase